ncbi:MAG TPA: AAA family ATPase [Candidatus Babeliales bacterium]|nr:AAA family ATPase [Candidatus Babeliales bacterium]
MLKLKKNVLSIIVTVSLFFKAEANVATAQDATEKIKQEFAQAEQDYFRTRYQQKCELNGLAGTFPMSICFLIHQLMHSISDPECCFNALLLYGPPGTGKTTIAERIAQTSSAKLIRYSAASMVTKMQGSGAQSIIDMFKIVDETLDAKDENNNNLNHKVVLFVDEIDAFSKDRDNQANDDQINALLEFMQQVVLHKDNARLVIIVATNRKESLDQAFLSRFKLVEVGLPDRDMCEKILKLHLSKYSYNPTLDSKQFAVRLHELKMSGRDIENIVREARQKSKMNGAKGILNAALEDATQEMVEQKEKILEEEQKKKYQEEREEQVTEMNYKMTKQNYDERVLDKALNHKSNDKSDEESDDSWVSLIKAGAKKLSE